MAVTFEDIKKDFSTKSFKNIYILHGEEVYYIDLLTQLFEEQVLTEEEKAFNQVILYGKDVDFKNVIDEVSMYPMLGQKRLVIVKEAQELKTITSLSGYIQKPVQHSILVLCHKYKKLDKRTSFYKEVEKNAVVFESKKIYDDKLPSWIQQYVTESHYKIDPKAALLAAEYLGNDLKKVANEFKKICISHPQNEVITPQIVAEHIGISKDFTVFDLQKALGEKDFVKCFRIIQHFVENPKANPSVMVISSLFTFFQKVHTSIYHQKDSNEILAKKLGLNSAYFISDYRVAAKNYTLIQVMDIIEALHKADLLSKGVGARNMNDATLYKDILIACMPR